MSQILQVDLLPKKATKTRQIIEKHDPNILSRSVRSPRKFMQESWSAVEAILKKKKSNSLNGKVFESHVAILAYKKGLNPLYIQADIAFVPNVKFDLVVYSEEFGPIVLSVKTSLRERYKQVDLEGWVLKQVHRQAKTYLITADEETAKTVNQKIAQGEVMGIEQVVFAFGKDMNDLIFELKQLKLGSPGTADIMTASKVLT